MNTITNQYQNLYNKYTSDKTSSPAKPAGKDSAPTATDSFSNPEDTFVPSNADLDNYINITQDKDGQLIVNSYDLNLMKSGPHSVDEDSLTSQKFSKEQAQNLAIDAGKGFDILDIDPSVTYKLNIGNGERNFQTPPENVNTGSATPYKGNFSPFGGTSTALTFDSSKDGKQNSRVYEQPVDFFA